MLPFATSSIPRGGRAWLVAIANVVILLVAIVLLAGCGTTAQPRVAAAPPVVAPTATRVAAPIADRAFVVVASAEGAFALTAPTNANALASSETRVLFRSAAVPTSFVVVGPAGQCRAESREQVVLALPSTTADAHTWTARALSDCAHAVAEDFALALPGGLNRASWLDASVSEQQQLTPDPELGQDEVWLSRLELPHADFRLYQATLLHHVTPAHSEESLRVVITDELDQPVESYDDYAVRGIVQTDAGYWVTLLGHDDPESVRVVRVLPGEGRIALDARISVFGE
jgi:hypothetical protein